MAVQSLIEQTIAFISPDGHYDQSAILANSLILSLQSNSLGQKLVFGYKDYADTSTGTQVLSSVLELVCYIAPSFQATVQSNIPALQSAFPQYTIVTWGGAVQFGN